VGFPDIIEAGMDVSAKADMRYSGFDALKISIRMFRHDKTSR
jgi:hypothetical protein